MPNKSGKSDDQLVRAQYGKALLDYRDHLKRAGASMLTAALINDPTIVCSLDALQTIREFTEI